MCVRIGYNYVRIKCVSVVWYQARGIFSRGLMAGSYWPGVIVRGSYCPWVITVEPYKYMYVLVCWTCYVCIAFSLSLLVYVRVCANAGAYYHMYTTICSCVIAQTRAREYRRFLHGICPYNPSMIFMLSFAWPLLIRCVTTAHPLRSQSKPLRAATVWKVCSLCGL